MKYRQEDRRMLDLYIRPKQIAFVLPSRVAHRQLVKLIQYNSHVWGGLFNFFIPTHHGKISSDWQELLKRRDPDAIYVVGGSKRLRRELGDIAQPSCIYKWNDKRLDELHDHGYDYQVRTVSLNLMLRKEFRHAKIEHPSNLATCSINERNPYYLHAVSLFGFADRRLSKWYEDRLGAQHVQYGRRDLHEFLDMFTKVRELQKPIDMSCIRLNIGVQDSILFLGSNVFDIFLSAGDLIEDFCLYWYIRAFMRRCPLFLPLHSLGSKVGCKVLGDWLAKIRPKVDYLRLYSSSLTRAGAQRLRLRLQKVLGARYHYEIHFCNFNRLLLGAELSAYEYEESIEASFVDEEHRLRAYRPSGIESSNSMNSWMMDIDIRGITAGDNTGYWLCKIPSFDPLFLDTTGRFPQHNLKVSSQHTFSVPVYGDDKYIDILLRRPEELFLFLLEKYGCRPFISEKTKYIRGIINLAGELEFLAFLQDKNKRTLFEELIRVFENKQIGFEFTNIHGILKSGKDHNATRKFIGELSSRRILLRGYNLECPHCGMKQWYSIKEIEETVSCRGCFLDFQIHPEAVFSYRLNELFTRGIEKAGAIPVILTLQFLSNLSRDSFIFFPGMTAKQQKVADLDIMALCDRKLLVAECKDLRQGSSEETIHDIKGQFKKVSGVALKIGARACVLSTLLSRDEVKFQQLQNFVSTLDVGGRLRHEVLSLEDLDKGTREVPVPGFSVPRTIQIEDLLPTPPTLRTKCVVSGGKSRPPLTIG